jgi:hypothetical protein
LCDTASVTIVVQPLAGAGIQYRLVTIDYDILGNAIAATVQMRTAAAAKVHSGRGQLDGTVGRAERTRGIARLYCIESGGIVRPVSL